MATILPAVPVPVTFTAVTAALEGVSTTGQLTFYDYGPQLLAIDAEMKAIGASLTAMGAAVELISLELVKLQEFLLAVQSPTGDFRTLSPEDVTATAIVQSALAKNVPPIVPTGGVTT